jgi:hypothetical protein
MVLLVSLSWFLQTTNSTVALAPRGQMVNPNMLDLHTRLLVGTRRESLQVVYLPSAIALMFHMYKNVSCALVVNFVELVGCLTLHDVVSVFVAACCLFD